MDSHADITESAGVHPGRWWSPSQSGDRHIECKLCPRRCRIAPDKRGFCFVRGNRGGQIVSTTYGLSTGFCIDPIEKKPLNHFYPGSAVLSFGTPGCNLGCRFCQNWTMSRAQHMEGACEEALPEAVALAAEDYGCRCVAFTYNDPIIWAEYAIDTARACRERGIKAVAVTSGYISADARADFFSEMDAANVDLKAFSEDFYVKMTGGHLLPVLDTLRWIARESKVWLEITNLVIPGANDSPEELRRMCSWIAAELGSDVPLHFSAFHPEFQLVDREGTPIETLLRAHEIAVEAGLRYVYVGNVYAPEHQHTFCPGCGRVAVERLGFELGAYHVQNGRCGHCGTPIAGCFADYAGTWGSKRRPVGIPRLAQRRPPPIASSGEPWSQVAPDLERSSAGSRASTESFETIAQPPLEQSLLQPVLSEADREAIVAAAARRVAATVRAEPCEPVEQVLGAAAETLLYGVFVTLKRGRKLRACCGFLGEPVELGEALRHAARRAATDDPRFPPISADELKELSIDVWLLWGLTPVTARGERRAAAIEIGRHGAQVMRGGTRGLLLPNVAVEHGLSAAGLLEQVCSKAGLPHNSWLSDDVQVMTFEGLSLHGELANHLPSAADESPAAMFPDGAASNAPTGNASDWSSETREPAVAGAFYPALPQELQQRLTELFDQPEVQSATPEPWTGALVPHAGWIYSGRLAARVLARIRFPSQVIVVCPRHRARGARWAIAPYRSWRAPGIEMAGDPELAHYLADRVDGLKLDAEAHRAEHAIEVHLPLLHRLAPGLRVSGVTVGGGELSEMRELAAALAEALRPLPERPLLLVSSDMNHFADLETTRRLDGLAIEALRSLRSPELHQVVRRNRISMCGVLPAVLVTDTLRNLGLLTRAELVGYCTSAEASGDTRRVVGYAGVLFG
ncbi:MAG: AmmeMemoRadiSam system radical SAM enzyme [Planctomycetota bacterium]